MPCGSADDERISDVPFSHCVRGDRKNFILELYEKEKRRKSLSSSLP